MSDPTTGRGPASADNTGNTDNATEADGAGTAGEPNPVPADAIQALRQRRDPRWVEISDRILDRALRATRPSVSVAVATPEGPIRISEQVVTAYVRQAVDGVLPGVAMMRLVLHLQGRDQLSGVTVCLIAQYGVDLLRAGDETRRLTRATLEDLLGTDTDTVTVEVTAMRVHFEDVLRGDPAIDDPWPT